MHMMYGFKCKLPLVEKNAEERSQQLFKEKTVFDLTFIMQLHLQTSYTC